MCRMIGAVFRNEFPLAALSDLRRVAEVGVVPGEEWPGHRDGWGIVSFMSGSPRYVGRSPRPMHLDPSFDSAVHDLAKLEAPNMLIAHARAASKGSATMENTHPFIVGGVVLAHNGTVYDIEPPRGSVPKGESDSEVLAMLLAERYSEDRDLWRAVRSLIREDIAPRRLTAAVLLASDGRELIGYRDFAKQDRSSYYDLRIAESRDSAILFQESLGEQPGDVTQVAKGEQVSVSLDLSVRREMIG